MGILITAGLGIIVAIVCCIIATQKNMVFTDNPDWVDYAVEGVKQAIFVAIADGLEMFLFILLVDNSEIVRNTNNTPEFFRAIAAGFAYMVGMYLVAKGYMAGAKLSED
jgi:hypothetical protein